MNLDIQTTCLEISVLGPADVKCRFYSEYIAKKSQTKSDDRQSVSNYIIEATRFLAGFEATLMELSPPYC